MESIWSMKTKFKDYPSLKGDFNVDTAVIGGGMAGLLTAYRLKCAGINCAVIEAGRICSGQTKNTTAKITAQHGAKYSGLLKDFGKEQAYQYYKANSQAIDEYEKIINEKNIDCGFKRLPSYLYSEESDHALDSEYKACEEIGIPAELTDKTSLPFKVRSALCFENQAQFDPLKFIEGIADELEIYENTRVIEYENGRLITDRGTVNAKRIVFATHFPVKNHPGYYFARMHQERSYVLALENAAELDGMYLGVDNDGLSFRNSGKYLLLGGGSHRTGENRMGGKYETLRQAAMRYFPESRERTFWSAQDCITLDGVPYIGLFSSSLPDVYVATGFAKWGMTTSMAASMIISDLILNGKTEFSVFSPQRFNLSASAKNLLKDGGKSIKGLSSEVIMKAGVLAKDLPLGHGGIVEYKGEKMGVYKDKDGNVYAVKNRCPHLGCQLEWNPDEKSWECPCHGSRFDYKGNLIDCPSVKSLNE